MANFKTIVGFLNSSAIGPFSVWHFLFMFFVIYLWVGASKKSAHVSHILVKDAAVARVLKAQLDKVPAAEDLKDLFYMIAEKTSVCPSGKSSGGDLGCFGPGQMVPAFDRVCWDAPVGKVQGPVETQFGHHLILVHKRVDDEEGKKTR